MFDFAERPLHAIPVVVLDTETTGLHPGLGHRVIEIGAIRYENGQRVAEFETLLNPGRPIDPQAIKITGIDDADVVDAPPFTEIRPGLDQFLNGALLVAHNAPFDANFLGLEYRLATPDAPPKALILPNPWLCTLKLARGYFHFGRNGLSDVARQLGVPVARAHRALNDVITTADVLWRMVNELQRRYKFETTGDFLHAQGEPIYAPPPVQISLPAVLDDALTERSDVEILYLGSGKEETERVITPHYATYHRDAAYLIAYCHLREEMRTFRVDRILGASVKK